MTTRGRPAAVRLRLSHRWVAGDRPVGGRQVQEFVDRPRGGLALLLRGLGA
ncbi:hypothetical protein ABTX60_25185 [Streptomyces sp. NPDC126510]|uniref:hypothetical protein n=1 Tax=Streptomyces sp. NPDC126510 TaxID=3155317 RepID=UPI00332AE636